MPKSGCQALFVLLLLYLFKSTHAEWQAEITSSQVGRSQPNPQTPNPGPHLCLVMQLLLENSRFYNYFFQFEAVGFLNGTGHRLPEFVLMYEYAGSHYENNTASAVQTQFVLFTPLKDTPLFINATEFADDTLLDVESDRGLFSPRCLSLFALLTPNLLHRSHILPC